MNMIYFYSLYSSCIFFLNLEFQVFRKSQLVVSADNFWAVFFSNAFCHPVDMQRANNWAKFEVNWVMVVQLSHFLHIDVVLSLSLTLNRFRIVDFEQVN